MELNSKAKDPFVKLLILFLLLLLLIATPSTNRQRHFLPLSSNWASYFPFSMLLTSEQKVEQEQRESMMIYKTIDLDGLNTNGASNSLNSDKLRFDSRDFLNSFELYSQGLDPTFKRLLWTLLEKSIMLINSMLGKYKFLPLVIC